MESGEVCMLFGRVWDAGRSDTALAGLRGRRPGPVALPAGANIVESGRERYACILLRSAKYVLTNLRKYSLDL